MPMLTIVASITAKPGKVEFVKDELLKLIEVTCAEKGCLKYDLHQDNNNPAHFIFYENWENRELWRAHMEAPHLKAYLDATEGSVDSFQISEMEKIS